MALMDRATYMCHNDNFKSDAKARALAKRENLILVQITFCKWKYIDGIACNRGTARHGEMIKSLVQTARHSTGVAMIWK